MVLNITRRRSIRHHSTKNNNNSEFSRLPSSAKNVETRQPTLPEKRSGFWGCCKTISSHTEGSGSEESALSHRPLLQFTPLPDIVKAVPSMPDLRPESTLSAPSFHIQPTPMHLIDTPSKKTPKIKQKNFQIHRGLVQCVETGDHIAAFLIPLLYVEAVQAEIELFFKNHTEEPRDVISRCTNVETWHRTRLFRVFALIGRGIRSDEAVKKVLHMLHKKSIMINKYGLFDLENHYDREVHLSLSSQPRRETNTFFRWLGEDGLAVLYKDLNFKLVVEKSEARIVIHNGDTIRNDVRSSSSSSVSTSRTEDPQPNDDFTVETTRVSSNPKPDPSPAPFKEKRSNRSLPGSKVRGKSVLPETPPQK